MHKIKFHIIILIPCLQGRRVYREFAAKINFISKSNDKYYIIGNNSNNARAGVGEEVIYGDDLIITTLLCFRIDETIF